MSSRASRRMQRGRDAEACPDSQPLVVAGDNMRYAGDTDPPSCPVCSESDIPGSLKCDICSAHFHAVCVGISKDVLATLMSIIESTGWVCPNCRKQSRVMFMALQSSQAKVVEELAEVKVAVRNIEKQLETVINDSAKLTEHGKSVRPAVTINDAVTAVHLDKVDKQRRSRNVIVTGLRPVSGTDDADLFAELCETALPVKPAFNRDRCRRLGASTKNGVQVITRPLLVQLDNEDNVSSLLRCATNLRESEAYKDVYINPDLTPAEREAAFLLRKKRREARARAQGHNGTQSSPSCS